MYFLPEKYTEKRSPERAHWKESSWFSLPYASLQSLTVSHTLKFELIESVTAERTAAYPAVRLQLHKANCFCISRTYMPTRWGCEMPSAYEDFKQEEVTVHSQNRHFPEKVSVSECKMTANDKLPASKRMKNT